tara:strand:- start:2191 stop:2613 length:423 start_codon:yes stop_codon:yes gene_type:complete
MARKRKNKLDFNDLVRADKHLKNNVPKIIGERARRFFELSFRKQGFTDTGFSKWKRRKRETKRSIGKNILSNTGMLKNSIRRTKTTKKQIRISSVGIPYANIHNQGIGKMPKRQFIGNSETLEKGLQKRIEYEIKKFINL